MPLTINIEKSKEITRERLRADRKPLLEAQDVLYMRATESGDDASSVILEKQRLRDITKQVDGAQTLDELKAMGVEE